MDNLGNYRRTLDILSHHKHIAMLKWFVQHPGMHLPVFIEQELGLTRDGAWSNLKGLTIGGLLISEKRDITTAQGTIQPRWHFGVVDEAGLMVARALVAVSMPVHKRLVPTHRRMQSTRYTVRLQLLARRSTTEILQAVARISKPGGWVPRRTLIAELGQRTSVAESASQLANFGLLARFGTSYRLADLKPLFEDVLVDIFSVSASQASAWLTMAL